MKEEEEVEERKRERERVQSLSKIHFGGLIHDYDSQYTSMIN